VKVSKRTKILAVVGLTITLFIGYRMLSKPKLEYFTASEFRLWWPLMSNDLLLKLDLFRAAWGRPVHVSPVIGAIGRNDGDGDTGQHNFDMWQEVRAIDVFPEGIDEFGGRERAYQIAKEIGFTGIGLYRDTHFKGILWTMLHVDVRVDEVAGDPAKWSRIDGAYLGLNEAIA